MMPNAPPIPLCPSNSLSLPSSLSPPSHPTGPVYQLSAQAVCPALSGPSSGHRGDFPKRFAGSSGHIQVQSLKRLCSAPRSPGTDPPVPVPYMLCGDPVDPLTWALLKSLQISILKKLRTLVSFRAGGFLLGHSTLTLTSEKHRSEIATHWLSKLRKPKNPFLPSCHCLRLLRVSFEMQSHSFYPRSPRTKASAPKLQLGRSAC